MDFNWKSIVGTVAPALATALGGPLAGMATAAIAKACGLGDGASQEDVMAAVQNMTPEQLAALKQAEFEFKSRMKELDVDLVRIAAADRDSAKCTPRTHGLRVFLRPCSLDQPSFLKDGFFCRAIRQRYLAKL